MKPFDFAFLTDDNIQPAVVSFLKQENVNVISVYDSNLQGKPDNEILVYATTTERVILTHDNDFQVSLFVNTRF